MTGHLLGGSGAVEAVITALALHDGFIPATINYQVPDEECDLDIVPNEGRNVQVEYALFQLPWIWWTQRKYSAEEV